MELTPIWSANRSASSSPLEENLSVKKQKLDSTPAEPIKSPEPVSPFEADISFKKQELEPTPTRVKKRSAPSSPLEDKAITKKQKLDSDSTQIPVIKSGRMTAHVVDDDLEAVQTSEIEDTDSQKADIMKGVSSTDTQPETETEATKEALTVPEIEATKDSATLPETGATEEPAKKEESEDKPKRKAGDGFMPWSPPAALALIPAGVPEAQPHWGIVPRPGGYERPSDIQPSARDSNGAVQPPLWEDRKGGVRLKRGSRIMNGYDQADHMWLQLMDLRPKNAKNPQPRRTPIGYYYVRGMPVDWNDQAALNDLNKALQAAIRNNSNKETSFSTSERWILANIFYEHPEVSLLDAAELFNERAHPVLGSEEGQYPSGRFTESIQHEFRMYKSAYVQGIAPTDETQKDSPHEQHYKTWKAAQPNTKPVSKKTIAKKPKESKEPKDSEEPKDPEEPKASKEPKAATKKTKSAKKPSDKMSNTAGIKKKRYFKEWLLSEEEMVARADATYREIMEKEAAEEAAKAAKITAKAGTGTTTAADDSQQVVEHVMPMAEQPRLSDDEEELLELAGAYEGGDELTTVSSDAAAHSAIVSPSDESETADREQEQEQVTHAPELSYGSPIADGQVTDASSGANDAYGMKAMRDIELDENYDEEL